MSDLDPDRPAPGDDDDHGDDDVPLGPDVDFPLGPDVDDDEGDDGDDGD